MSCKQVKKVKSKLHRMETILANQIFDKLTLCIDYTMISFNSIISNIPVIKWSNNLVDTSSKTVTNDK